MLTRSQAAARIADRTASQHLRGHVALSFSWPFDSTYAISYWWFFGTKPLSLTVSEIFNVEYSTMVGMTLIRPPNEGQGHSFRYQLISYIRLPIGSQYSNFCSRTHCLATIHSVQTTEGRNTVPTARPLVRSAKKYYSVGFKRCCWQHGFIRLAADASEICENTRNSA